MSQPIQPLRIQKNTPSSPTKLTGLPMQRPLSELSPMSQRRNSPSYNQNTKISALSGDSSPFDPSPFASNSPRLYWQSRDTGSPTRWNSENRAPTDQRDSSPTPAKRSSIENLKRASRVKNSNMFAREQKQEYDPTSSPMIERPLASGRPLSVQVQGNSYGGRGPEGFRKEVLPNGHKFPVYSPPKIPVKMDALPEISQLPSKTLVSPTKSSMSSKSRYAQSQAFGSENGIWSDDEEESLAERELPPGKSLHRHAKSVTFDAAPPQVNEYEMTTPDPSSVASGSREGSYDSVDNEEEESFDRGSSIDREDSFDASLEDTDKTPVVLPEDWRLMSPATANDDLAAHVENPFDREYSSPAPTARPSSAVDARASPVRTDSANSNGERRPLPPLPGLNMPVFSRPRSESNGSLSATAERVSSTQHILPSPPQPASISKSEIQGMGGCSMSLEDRLRLMMAQDEDKAKSPAEEQRERRLRRAQSKSPDHDYDNRETGVQIHEDEVDNDDVADLGDYERAPRISRESILRKVQTQRAYMNDEESQFSSPAPSESPGRRQLSEIDPDTPLPSLETESCIDYGPPSPVIKKEDDGEESEIDVYSIPDLYSQHLEAESYMDAVEGREALEERLGQVASQAQDDNESHYSNDSTIEDQHKLQPSAMTGEEGLPTPRASSPSQTEKVLERKSSHRMSLPQFASMLGEHDLSFGMESFLTPTPPLDEEPVKASPPREPLEASTPPKSLKAESSLDRPVTPELQLEPPSFPGQFNDEAEEPRTPDSVIRHPISESPPPDSPSVPEPIATIKAPGGKLKTRPSITPADIRAMAETRRQVSGEIPSVPSIPMRHQNRPSVVMESSMIDYSDDTTRDSGNEANPEQISTENNILRQPKRKSSLVQLDIPVDGGDGLGFGLDKEFDRVIEAQKVAFIFPSSDTGAQPRSPGYAEYIGGQGFKPIPEYRADNHIRTQKGYLMRQNTKVVIASSASHESASDTNDAQEPSVRGTRSAGSSPRKASHTQTWTTEPWNGKVRRKSIRQSGGSPQKKPSSGPAPPLPGQQSNVASALGSVNEDETMLNSEEVEDGAERGRLFVKVVRVKDLNLPLPRGERSYFALTLDNGLHCVTTAWLELGKTAPIGQEFELVVLNDLEFQLTLQTKLEEPKVKPMIEPPTKVTRTPKPSTFSRVFASPRKRKELEMKQQEEAQRADHQKQQDSQASRRAAQPTAWDLLNGLVAKDGSFARSYVCLKDHESNAYGRPYTVDVPCFNEWATEEVQSVKSKRSGVGGGVQRKAPYRIGKLELQLLFVPKPKGGKDEDMPKSMNACIRELKEAELTASKSWEGVLSQQGGDCPYWRRRFFRLDGPKLTAYHESTRQPRATINLAKASKLIDDKSSLMRKETSSKSGGRRKSAFAEEEEGYMFVEEGFRVRFGNGETIDFYADSAAEKDGWMKVLADVVGKDTGKVKGWTDLVLSKQRTPSSRAAQAEQVQAKAPPTRSAPPTPAKQHSPSKRHSNQAFAPAPVQKDSRHPAVAQRRAEGSKARSMVF